MDIFRFRKFPVYILTREFRSKIKSYTISNFPKSENYVLRSQLWRALDSVLLNIAEGSDHYSGTEFSKFLNTALTSLNEVVACLDCAFDDNYLDNKQLEEFSRDAENIAKQLKAFSSKVRNNK